MVRVLSLNVTDGGTTLHRPLLARLDELAPKDRSWWVVLSGRAESLLRFDERISLAPTVYVPYMLHEDRAAGILAHTFP